MNAGEEGTAFCNAMEGGASYEQGDEDEVPLVVLCALVVAAPAARGSWVVNGAAICTAWTDQQTPQIISDGAGGAIIAWQDNRNGSLDIYVSEGHCAGCRSMDAQWRGCLHGGRRSIDTTPAIAPDGAGGAIVTWHDSRILPNPGDLCPAGELLGNRSVGGEWCRRMHGP